MIRFFTLLILGIIPLLGWAQSTQTKNDAGEMGGTSGFYETYAPVNYPTGASSWWHLLDVRHSNGNNNYAMQLAGSFFDQNFYLRKTNGSGQQPWLKIVTENDGKVGMGTTADQLGLIVQGNTINADRNQHYVAITLDGDYGNGTGNYSQIRSYSNLYDYWGSRLAFFTTSSTAANTLLERMRIDANGNVGIGTSIPQVPLHVNGKGLFNGNLKVMAAGEAWAEGLTVVRPDGWAGLRFARNDPGSGNFEGNWAIGYSGFTGNDFTISNQTGGVQYNALLHIRSDNQFVGIGTANPTERLTVNGNIMSGQKITGGTLVASRNDGNTAYTELNNGTGRWWLGTGINAGSDALFGIYDVNNGINRFIINPAGNIGIGMNYPTERLTVNGKIKASEIRVDGAGAPDYVFEPGYKVETLEALESYIKTNKHLPEVPSAKEFERDGIAVGEMNKLLLKKIEELTLHLIEKDKELKAQVKINKDFESRLLKLENGNK